jgi:hypothetical protein
MMDYKDVASVLESAAEYIDGIESTKQAAETAARDARIDKLASRYEASTGESIPMSLKEKLATLDVDTLDHVLKVAHNSSDSPESLGSPADISDSPAPRTVKEASVQAEDRFLSWIVND